MRLLTLEITAAAMLLASCGNARQYDAQGFFEATEVTVSAEGAGKILALDLEEGDTLQRGEQVGMVDTLQLYIQKLEARQQYASLMSSRPDVGAQLSALRHQLAGAVTERDRQRRLWAEGATTARQLDNAETQAAALEGQIEGLKSSLQTNISALDDKAKAVKEQIAAIDTKIANCAITAPISGTVITKIAQAGEVTGFGAPLFRMANMEEMYLRAYFTSDRLSGLRLGQKVRVTADYGGGNVKEYPGTVTYISPTSEFTPKAIQTSDSRANLVYAVKISVPNDGLLKIGLTGEVHLEDGSNLGK